ncbi:MAG: phytoene desaturase family protein, partial [Acetobacteraceae bacterium]
NVFFSGDSRAEFGALAAGRLPADPTVYVCAQDRWATGSVESAARPPSAERLFCILNAPARGDRGAGCAAPSSDVEIARCQSLALARLERCGLALRPEGPILATGPAEFDRLFPGTGGALYGPVPHGTMAAFRRPGTRTRIAGLYLAGGSTHPGAGLPMAALSGWLAAERLIADHASTGRSRVGVMGGGISMR